MATQGVQSIVGLGLEEAKTKAAKLGYSYRVVSEDGEAFIVTMDLNAFRLNFTVVKGKVTAVTVG